MSVTWGVVIAVVGLLADTVIVVGFFQSINKMGKLHARNEGIMEERMRTLVAQITEVKKYCDELDAAQREADTAIASITGKIEAVLSNLASVMNGQGKLEGMMVRHLEQSAPSARRKS